MIVETLFSEIPILKTERFILRDLRLTDAEAVFDLFSNEEVMKYDSNVLYTSLDEARLFIQRAHERLKEHKGLRWGITRIDDDNVIGTCSFHNFISDYRCVETGYDLNRTYWGQGVMVECMRGVLAYGFQDLGMERIEAVIDDANIASKKLLLKLGFTYEGCLRHRYLVRDHMQDEHYYGLLKSDWLQQTAPNTRTF